jgi:hypothetical protein
MSASPHPLGRLLANSAADTGAMTADDFSRQAEASELPPSGARPATQSVNAYARTRQYFCSFGFN